MILDDITESCDLCDGSGAVNRVVIKSKTVEQVKCPKCEGSGWILSTEGRRLVVYLKPFMDGTRTVWDAGSFEPWECWRKVGGASRRGYPYVEVND